MSIKIMSRVWEKSAASGSALLLLLAIADHADDNGLAWPGIETLAAKIRMTPQSVHNLTRELVKAGELEKISRAEKGRSNLYIILTDTTPDQLCAARARAQRLGGGSKVLTPPPQPSPPPPKIEPAEFEGGGKIAILGGDQIAVLPEPSMIHQSNHQEPSVYTAPAGDAPILPPSKEPRQERQEKPAKEPPPPAVEAFRESTGRYPNRTLWPGIVEVVGSEPAEVDRFKRVCTAYVACGWNQANVKGMLQFYARHEIPGDGNGHGRRPPPSSDEPASWPAIREAVRRHEAGIKPPWET